MVCDWILSGIRVFFGVLAFRENSPLIDPEKLKHLRENVDWVLAGQPHNWFTEMSETIEALWKENESLSRLARSYERQASGLEETLKQLKEKLAYDRFSGTDTPQ